MREVFVALWRDPQCLDTGRGRLSGEQRRTTAFHGGHVQPEVATLTGVSAGTVGTRLYSGAQRLRRLLISTRSRASADSSGSAR